MIENDLQKALNFYKARYTWLTSDR